MREGIGEGARTGCEGEREEGEEGQGGEEVAMHGWLRGASVVAQWQWVRSAPVAEGCWYAVCGMRYAVCDMRC